VIRLFSRLESLNKIIVALGNAIGPVINACMILLIVSCVYAVVATGLYKEVKPEYFGRFQLSLFTMFQILSGDSWASQVFFSSLFFVSCASRVVGIYSWASQLARSIHETLNLKP